VWVYGVDNKDTRGGSEYNEGQNIASKAEHQTTHARDQRRCSASDTMLSVLEYKWMQPLDRLLLFKARAGHTTISRVYLPFVTSLCLRLMSI
jgi:hypothetical protein